MSAWLALDLSKACTGWAFWNGKPDQKARLGHWKLGSEYTRRGRVFNVLQQNMRELYEVTPFDKIFYEEPINPGSLQGHTTIGTILLATGLSAHVESFADAVSAPDMAINVSTWRKDFIGKQKRGTISSDLKAMTMERCRQLGFEPRKNDEADALGILTYALLLNGVTPPWLAAETLRQPLTIKK